jgi:sugar lactone lactonase YvrE
MIRLNRPRSLVFDRACNLYIADPPGDRVVKVEPSGAVTTNPARLKSPQSISADSRGNIYVGTDDARVLVLRPDGSVRSVAGNGSCSGGAPPSGAADQATVCLPSGLASDGQGNLYVADGANRYVARVSPGGGISTIAGIGERVSSGDGGPAALARIGDPLAVAIDAAGALYVSDGYSTTVRKIAAGRISRFAGGGTGSSAGPQPALAADIYPTGLALDARGDLFIADDLHHQVRKVSTDGVMETVAGTGLPGRSGDGGPATAATLRFPQGVALDGDGNLYIADTGNDHIRRVTRDGTITTVV